MEPSSRLQSLDVFRGVTIASMILVNNPGSGANTYPPLLHAEWHGWTFTDMVFPFFLWIVGVAMTLSFAKRIERGGLNSTLAFHTVRRAALIFLTGTFLNLFPDFDFAGLRIPGVLQRIAVCYLFAGLIYLYTSPRATIVITVVLLAVYPALMLTFGAGWDKGDNFAAAVDQVFLSGHMWSHTRTWDPEGIVSTIPAIATVLFGILTGEMLRAKRSPVETAVRIFAAGTVLTALGNLLGLWIPVNKSLWTSSYAVLMAGLAALAFALCYWSIDILQGQTWTKPFAIYGSNALAVYVLSGVVADLIGGVWKIGGTSAKEWIYQNVMLPIASPGNASLLYALANVLALYGVAWFLWRRRWFLRF
ncbi:MAG: acyltransferase family protein [Bryobacteraceae bacterium]